MRYGKYLILTFSYRFDCSIYYYLILIVKCVVCISFLQLKINMYDNAIKRRMKYQANSCPNFAILKNQDIKR